MHDRMEVRPPSSKLPPGAPPSSWLECARHSSKSADIQSERGPLIRHASTKTRADNNWMRSASPASPTSLTRISEGAGSFAAAEAAERNWSVTSASDSHKNQHPAVSSQSTGWNSCDSGGPFSSKKWPTAAPSASSHAKTRVASSSPGGQASAGALKHVQNPNEPPDISSPLRQYSTAPEGGIFQSIDCSAGFMAKEAGELRFDAPMLATSSPLEAMVDAVSASFAPAGTYASLTPPPHAVRGTSAQHPMQTLTGRGRDCESDIVKVFGSVGDMQSEIDSIQRTLHVLGDEGAEERRGCEDYPLEAKSSWRPHVVGQAPSCSPSQMVGCWPNALSTTPDFSPGKPRTSEWQASDAQAQYKDQRQSNQRYLAREQDSDEEIIDCFHAEDCATSCCGVAGRSNARAHRYPETRPIQPGQITSVPDPLLEIPCCGLRGRAQVSSFV